MLLTLAVALAFSAMLGVRQLASSIRAQPQSADATVTHVDADAARARDLAARHGCWSSGPQSDGVDIPNHAIVMLPGDDDPRRLPSSVGFDIWKAGAPGVLYAFCP